VEEIVGATTARVIPQTGAHPRVPVDFYAASPMRQNSTRVAGPS
jgi:hypothetical protein